MLENLIDIDKQLTLLLNGSGSLFLDGLAVTATSTLVWVALYLSLFYVIIRSGDMKFIALTVIAVVVCIVLADQGASGICKPLVQRFRPSQDPSLLLSVDIVGGYRGGMYGFFSSHAANTIAVATFFSLLTRCRPVTIHLYFWALLNCWTRVYLGVHYVGDLLVGIVYGTLMGCIVYFLYRKVIPAPSVSIKPDSNGATTASGFALSDLRIIPLALILTYIYICFCAVAFI